MVPDLNTRLTSQKGHGFLDRLKLRKPPGARVPEGSYFYGRLLPAVIVFMAIVMLALIVFALAVLVGLVR